MENFQITFRPDSGQKAEVVLNVLKDIEYQNQIEKRVLLPTDVGQFELKLFVCPALTHLYRLRRDLVAAKTARFVQFALQQSEHFARTASHLAYGSRLQTVSL